MRFTTKTEYGIICLLFMARNRDQEIDPITIRQIASQEDFSVTYTEKILQSLRAAGIVTSVQGKQGGYILARRPSEITLKDIVEALEGATFDVFCEPENRKEIVCTHFSLCGLKPLWWRTKDLLDRFYGGITLEMLGRNDLETGDIGSSPAEARSSAETPGDDGR